MKLKLAALFSDHMVLQRGEPVPVWGWSSPGSEVSVRYVPGKGCRNRKQLRKAVADRTGKWLVHLAPLVASTTGASLVVRSGSADAVEAEDVLVGEVWLASGQSNMEWVVKNSNDSEMEMKTAKWRAIRMFTVPRIVHENPVDDVNARWEVCSPEKVGDFSAVAYFFARELHRREKVPFGILNASWGGTRIETWIGREALLAEESCRAEVLRQDNVGLDEDTESARLRREERQEYIANPTEWLRKNVTPDPGNEGFDRGWAAPSFDDSSWPLMEIPSTWQVGGVEGNGVVWFRRYVDIPEKWAGRDITVSLSACDKHDTSYFNNEKIGGLGWETTDPWNICRKYVVPGRLVRAGRNVLAVRVYSYRNAGGITGPETDMWMKCDAKGSRQISLAGQWRYRVEHSFGVITTLSMPVPEPYPNHNSPHALHDSMLNPLVPYALKGFIWYQGESNASNAAGYRSTFPAMIRDWRSLWGGRNLPFLFVQLANYLADGSWPLLREAQTFTLKEPCTGMAVTIDVGDKRDIHPRNKQAVGLRLALAAESVAYGRKLVYSGPLYRTHRCEKAAVRVWFDHAEGMAPAGGKILKGFIIAGKDRNFVEAKAVVEGDAVVVSASGVEDPVAVRYAWSDDPACNLYNKAGLPASPFRTDNWK